MSERGHRWWERHRPPYFFPWVWAFLLGFSFIGGILVGVFFAIWVLAVRGLV